MAKQGAFFLSPQEIYMKENPDAFKSQRKKKTGTKRAGTKRTGKRKSKAKTPNPVEFNCSTCSLKETSKFDPVDVQGSGGKKILLVMPSPVRTNFFRGESFELLKSTLNQVGISVRKDCFVTHVVDCHAPKGIKDKDAKCCISRLEKTIEETKPELIICFGGEAINAVLKPQELGKLSVSKMHGKVIPSQYRKCWVACSFTPTYYIMGKYRDEAVFLNDMIKAVAYLGEPLPKPLTMEGNEVITDSQIAIDLLDALSLSAGPVAIDYECTTLHPWEPGAQVLTIGLAAKVEEGFSIPIGMPGAFSEMEQAHIMGAMQRFLASDARKCVQNHAMEEIWSRRKMGQPMNNFIWDTMVSNHVLYGVRGANGLAFQVFEMVGAEYKDMVDITNLIDEKIEDVCNYNALDARYTLMATFHQFDYLQDDKFNDFFTECIPCMTTLKDRGVPIDRKVLDNFDETINHNRKQYMENMKNVPEFKEFELHQEKEFNIGSSKQLGDFIYDFLKEPQPKKKRSVDKECVELILGKSKNKSVIDFLDNYQKYNRWESFTKRVTEYQGLLDKNNRVHPSYNLHVAESFRSSATGPNIQNVFKHDPELKKFRKCIVPSPGNILLEADYGALEVRVIAMISKDPVLTKQIIDNYDLHYYWTSQLLKKEFDKRSEEGANWRYEGKNGFVFPSFYGSNPDSIARSYKGAGLSHIKKIQKEFWETYSNVKAWQNGIVDFYLENGYIETVNGFKRYGPLRDFQLYNTPIQGCAFHLLLASLRKIEEKFEKLKLKTKPIFEIHDSITFDTDPEEAEDVIEIVTDIMESKHFDWQGDVPLLCEWEISGSDWYSLETLE